MASAGETINSFPEVVDLNVGGVHYTAQLATLIKDADSRLAAMFTGQEPMHKDSKGRFFIDRDGVLFRYGGKQSSS